MKTKKTTRTATDKTSKREVDAMTRRNDLAKLNELFAKSRKAQDTLIAEYRKALTDMDDAFFGKKRSARLAEAQFNLWKKHMPPVKFNLATGEYFYAEDERGQEVFAIKVSKMESCVYVVAAKDLEDAKAKALEMFDKCAGDRSGVTEAEDYGR